jgi:hypothetical protein
LTDQSTPESVDEAVRRIQCHNERIITSLTTAGLIALVGYESVLSNLAAYENEVSKIEQINWFTAVIDAYATFIHDSGVAWAVIARNLLSEHEQPPSSGAQSVADT